MSMRGLAFSGIYLISPIRFFFVSIRCAVVTSSLAVAPRSPFIHATHGGMLPVDRGTSDA